MLSYVEKYKFAVSLLIGKAKEIEDIENRAIKNAYISVQRTFRFKGRNHSIPVEHTQKIIKNYLDYLKKIIEEIESKESVNNLRKYDEGTQKRIDMAFSNACNDIVSAFRDCNFECYFGQAQKWINITLKHLVLYSNSYNALLPYLHVPIDNVVYGMAEKLLKISKPDIAWSRMKEVNYIKYQMNIRNAIFNEYGHLISPFEWEWINWVKER